MLVLKRNAIISERQLLIQQLVSTLSLIAALRKGQLSPTPYSSLNYGDRVLILRPAKRSFHGSGSPASRILERKLCGHFCHGRIAYVTDDDATIITPHLCVIMEQFFPCPKASGNFVPFSCTFVTTPVYRLEGSQL